jgi:hypothetical protein
MSVCVCVQYIYMQCVHAFCLSLDKTYNRFNKRTFGGANYIHSFIFASYLCQDELIVLVQILPILNMKTWLQIGGSCLLISVCIMYLFSKSLKPSLDVDGNALCFQFITLSLTIHEKGTNGIQKR